MKPLVVVNVSELNSVDDPFIDLSALEDRTVLWRRFSGLPRNMLEHKIQRPRISRYRAAFEAVYAARGSAAIISHMPRMTNAVAAHGGKKLPPHLAFAFNFTDLPAQAERSKMAERFARVDQFCVYTQFEADMYASAFGIDRARFQPVTWTQDRPVLAADAVLPERPYVVAIGGEGRDFRTLVATARALPEVAFLVIARPHPALVDVPSNMTVRYNVPLSECWALAAGAEMLLVPLLGPETCCGHITIVSARLLGLPIITSVSRGTAEYTEDFAGTVLVPAGDTERLQEAILAIHEDPDAAHALASVDAVRAGGEYSRAQWTRYVSDFLERVA
ncbi:hypothetical protein [Sphingomonas echinoides]|uniref:hypothetical protein n=1 Tax=Sphingomonas echinoides TaxID=59803 RepID=UPI002413CB48|nr:hypothetical protein [Sphingomonas echinoides]